MAQYNRSHPMEAPLALHCWPHNLEAQTKLQSFFNLRKTQFSMRFARNKHGKDSPEHSQDCTVFPVVVNNRIRSFRSERSVKLEQEDLDTVDSPGRSGRRRRHLRNRAPRETLCRERKERTVDSLSSMFETIRIKKVGLAPKEADHMRRTEMSFKGKHGPPRQDSLAAFLGEREEKKAKSLKRESICGWETSLPDCYL